MLLEIASAIRPTAADKFCPNALSCPALAEALLGIVESICPSASCKFLIILPQKKN